MKTYTIHAYATVKLNGVVIKARNDQEAIEKATKKFSLQAIFSPCEVEPVGGIDALLIEREDSTSAWYQGDSLPL